MNIKKHIGRLKNTDRRIAVVFMQIPNKEDHALVVDTDSLPDSYHDALMHVVDSVEGQQTPILANILSRRVLPDTGQDIMSSLHIRGFMQAQPISNIVMFPRPNMPMPLEDIIKMMNQTPAEAQADVELVRDRFQEAVSLDGAEKNEALARNLIQQALDLKAEADRKLQQAYDIAPQFRPSQPTIPTPQEVVQVLREETEVAPAAVEVVELEDGRKSFSVDVGDLPSDVAAAYFEAVKAAEIQTTAYVAPEETVDAAHGVDVTDDAVQAFLDRAAYREDQAKAAEPVAKRPVGRPRKAK